MQVHIYCFALYYESKYKVAVSSYILYKNNNIQRVFISTYGLYPIECTMTMTIVDRYTYEHKSHNEYYTWTFIDIPWTFMAEFTTIPAEFKTKCELGDTRCVCHIILVWCTYSSCVAEPVVPVCHFRPESMPSDRLSEKEREVCVGLHATNCRHKLLAYPFQ